MSGKSETETLGPKPANALPPSPPWTDSNEPLCVCTPATTCPGWAKHPPAAAPAERIGSHRCRRPRSRRCPKRTRSPERRTERAAMQLDMWQRAAYYNHTQQILYIYMSRKTPLKRKRNVPTSSVRAKEWKSPVAICTAAPLRPVTKCGCPAVCCTWPSPS